jgi:hypothetical protein
MALMTLAAFSAPALAVFANKFGIWISPSRNPGYKGPWACI